MKTAINSMPKKWKIVLLFIYLYIGKYILYNYKSTE